MAATMGIYEINGASYTPGSGGTNVASGTITFGATDANSSPGPVVRGAGDVWSYEKWLHMRASGTFATITNPRWYATIAGGSGLATGVSVYVNDNAGGRTNTFVQPAVPTVDTNRTAFSTFPSGTPKELDYVNYGTGSQSNGSWESAGDIGDFIVMYAKVANTAGPGSMLSAGASCTATWAWDET